MLAVVSLPGLEVRPLDPIWQRRKPQVPSRRAGRLDATGRANDRRAVDEKAKGRREPCKRPGDRDAKGWKVSFAPMTFYPSDQRAISVPVDAYSHKEADREEVLIRSFGERYVVKEDLCPPRYRVLHLLPGGALEIKR